MNFGKEELGAKNNRGTWYVAQVARIAIYVGDRELARELVETVRTVRIPDQFQADGSQPHEVGRTKSLHYSFFNLSALAALARVGEHLEIDLWNDHTGKNADNKADNNGSMQSGLSYLGPHLLDQDEWPHKQQDRFQLTPQATEFLRMASVRYKNPAVCHAHRPSRAPLRKKKLRPADQCGVCFAGKRVVLRQIAVRLLLVAKRLDSPAIPVRTRGVKQQTIPSANPI